MEVIDKFHEKFILCANREGTSHHRPTCVTQERVHYEEYKAKLNQDPVMMDCLKPITIHAGNDLVRRLKKSRRVEDIHVVFGTVWKRYTSCT